MADAIGYKISKGKSAKDSPDDRSDTRVSNDPASRGAHAGYLLA
jgi:hypothetical protein